ncbi:hypothetical protein LWM68_46015 [Niabella sp. W65]|nr:hypothetical protein [Niabella sp. W65]MCH7369445.1 hypothetical protein [Niabella sp. W65]ULT44976.1 hypothetical protein KRR40_17725 [Niabella sp. I65]
MKVLTHLTGLVIFIAMWTDGIAQEQTLDPITVTSSLSGKRSSETGRNITIVRGKIS